MYYLTLLLFTEWLVYTEPAKVPLRTKNILRHFKKVFADFALKKNLSPLSTNTNSLLLYHSMKDYYYFLGISHDASEEDIKKAYRKLSLKYHPDKNQNDDFFADRFREIQEAYETLSDKSRRYSYDQNLESHQKSFRYNIPPSIKTFTANKIHAKKGEEIIISWQTQNADVVKVLPFGLEKPYGERIFKITEFKDGKFQVLLHATNSLLHKTAVQGITITEVFENNTEKFKDKAEELFKSQPRTVANPYGQPKVMRIIVAVILLVLAIYFLVSSFIN